MSMDIESNIFEKIRISGKFALHFDASTDISGHAQLLVNVRSVDEDMIKKNFFFRKRLPQNTTGQKFFVLPPIILNKEDLNVKFYKCLQKWSNSHGRTLQEIS